jgi:hypothetical protein
MVGELVWVDIPAQALGIRLSAATNPAGDDRVAYGPGILAEQPGSFPQPDNVMAGGSCFDAVRGVLESIGHGVQPPSWMSIVLER